jgi:N-acetyl-beta-hexosaminidase
MVMAMTVITGMGCKRVEKTDKLNTSLLPKPREMVAYAGHIVLAKDARLRFDQSDAGIKDIAEQMERMIQLADLPERGRGIIRIKLSEVKDIGPSGYNLTINKRKITLTAGEPAGLFYGMQTLRQLIPADGKGELPCLEITDYPAFGWRGLMLDCSWTFLRKEYVIKYIDRLAAIKINVLHLHLTDDQGWRIERFINSKGRKLIGWDEILEVGLAENAAVMSWRGIQGGIEAAGMGHKVVMSPTSHCYFDYSHETTPIEKVYSYQPVPGELPAGSAHFILGAQANMWTHIARTEEAIDQQVFPRLNALAEVLWTNPATRDFANLENRITWI